MWSFKPSHCADQVNAREEVARGFLVASGDGAELLDDVEEAFDEVAFAIEREIASALVLAVFLGRNDGRDLARFQAPDETIAVVALVADDGLRVDFRHERLGLRDVVDLSGGQADDERVAERVDDDVDFRRQPAARAPDRLVAVFFDAPALC